ncbi:MAG TPA: TolC family protein [Puia sp.]|nr:TolC family protein [Puia sp.]
MSKKINMDCMNNMGKIILAILLTNIFVATYAQTPAVHEFSIQQCLDYAKKNSVQVKNALLDLQIQQQSNKATTAGALPTITATGTTTDYFVIPQQPVSFTVNGVTTTTLFSLYQKYSANGTVLLTQTLFDGQVFVGLQARKASIDYYQKAIDITEESIAVNIYKVYYQLVVSRTQMQQLDANIARAEKLFHDTKAMFDNGFQEKLDVDKATVQLANLQTQKQSTQTTIDNGYFGLKY